MIRLLMATLIGLLLIGLSQAQTTRPTDMSPGIVTLHEALIYPVVRVLCGPGGGSGTILYSEDRDKKGVFASFCLTNHHVIDDAIKVEKKWSSLLNAYVDTETRQTVKVEVFRYERISKQVGRESFDSDIVAHSKDHDLALLRLRCDRRMQYVARIRPKDLAERAYLFDKTYSVGCSLLHSPIVTSGEITSLNDEIENKSFWLASSQIIFGNSGGAVFRQDSLEFIGVPSRVPVYGFGNAVTHMAYFVDLPRIYAWLEGECLSFIYGPKTPDECMKEREVLQRAAQFQRVSKDTEKTIPASAPGPK